MGDVQIREVTAGDVPAVAVLVREVLTEFGMTFGAGSETDAHVLGLPGSYRDHGGCFWVARGRGGELLGTCGVFPVAPATYELRKMYLHPASRGKCVGKKLLDEAIAWATERGAEWMVLDTHDAMERAIAFYESQGFVRDDRQMRAARCTRGYARRLRPG